MFVISSVKFIVRETKKIEIMFEHTLFECSKNYDYTKLQNSHLDLILLLNFALQYNSFHLLQQKRQQMKHKCVCLVVEGLQIWWIRLISFDLITIYRECYKIQTHMKYTVIKWKFQETVLEIIIKTIWMDNLLILSVIYAAQVLIWSWIVLLFLQWMEEFIVVFLLKAIYAE